MYRPDNILSGSFATGDTFKRPGVNSRTGIDANATDLHRVEHYSPGGLPCNAGGLILDAQSILQGHYKTTASSTDCDVINGEVTICSFAVDAGQRANASNI